MKRESAKTLALIAVLLAIAWTINVGVTHASAKTITVPTDYPTISEAINHASAGDTIYVKNGLYQENIVVNKALTLQGENRETTIIVGTGNQTPPPSAVTLAAHGAKISGFTVESQNYSSPNSYAYGITVAGNNCTVTDNIVTNNQVGVFCALQYSTTITQNEIVANVHDGIRFFGGSNNNISDNNITSNAVSGIAINGYSEIIHGNYFAGNFRGLGLGSSYSSVFGNTFSNNSESGIFLASSNSTISDNSFQSNSWGIYVTSQLAAPRSNLIYHNNFQNNTYYNAFDNSTQLAQSWDNGANEGGNYWSDWVGKGGYVVCANNIDNHPLSSPFDISQSSDVALIAVLPQAKPDSIVASWSFDTLEAGVIVPDATGNNPAVLGSESGSNSFIPIQVPGQFGEALSFNGSSYAQVPPSPSMLTPKDVTIDAWVNMQGFKNVTYSNIIVEAQRSNAALPQRTLGLAVNGMAPQNSSCPAIGSIRGFVTTQSGLNEIDTTTTIPLNQWVHVVFTRSATDGMHIYVDGKEQPVKVFSGSANPQGSILPQTEVYIGHDAIINIDSLQVSNYVTYLMQPLWTQWWLWTGIAAVILCLSGIALYKKFRA